MPMDIHSNTPGRFFRGLLYPYKALRFIMRHPLLYMYILIPLLINIIVFAGAAYFGIDFFGDLANHYFPKETTWYWSLLYGIFWFFSLLFIAVLVFFSFTVIGNLIASPFNDILSEKTEDLLTSTNVVAAPFSLSGFFKNSLKVVRDEIKKISLFVIAMLLLLLLNFIPGIGVVIYTFCSFLLTVYFLVIEYTGFVFGRKNRSFRDQRHFVRQNAFLCAGFGCGLFILLALPFLQLLCIPIGVVGAALLCHEIESACS